jgi:hypothetical protein
MHSFRKWEASHLTGGGSGGQTFLAGLLILLALFEQGLGDLDFLVMIIGSTTNEFRCAWN